MHALLPHIVLAQINTVVGDIAGNIGRMRTAHVEALAQGAKLVVFPELSVCGYPPQDLVLREAFRAECMRAVHELAVATKGGPALLLGSPWEEAGKTYNAALMLADGKIAHIQRKRRLPNDGIFDEKRIFTPGGEPSVCSFAEVKLGVLVCEDMWHIELVRELKAKGAEMLICINASPFEAGKITRRLSVAAEVVRDVKLPLVYLNMVGAQDDIVFDGGSFVMDERAHVVQHFAQFEEVVAAQSNVPALPHEEQLWRAAALGLSDYVAKNKFPGVLLGLSGGIDSALVAALAVDALGADKVLGVMLPAAHSSAGSIDDAKESARLLGIETLLLPINHAQDALSNSLTPAMQQAAPQFADWREHLAVGGNLQSRARGVLLMALSNATGKMLLNTGNKSEIAVGYSTLYGDSCGGYAPIKDVYKTQVYELAAWRNAQGFVIPQSSIDKPPSAELAPGQTDQDQLPPYDMLDAILALHVEKGMDAEAIIRAGHDGEMVSKIIRMVRLSEYKRRQMPPGPKLSGMLFSRDWRYPLTNECAD